MTQQLKKTGWFLFGDMSLVHDPDRYCIPAGIISPSLSIAILFVAYS